ncbi:MAG: rRNA maturation RNase YbeY [Akkermansiaceae bacterium]|nr:rRNA maturation RNase YbeY [Akkermansiaceae bacterium]
MSEIPKLAVYDHQHLMKIDDGLVSKLEKTALEAMPMVLDRCNFSNSALSRLKIVEVSLVDDATIADVHERFMNIAGATDVITFDHGEIHISIETAQRQAAEYFQDFEKEIMLYILHGLLHLAGHEDASDAGYAAMDLHQNELLSRVWQP